MRDIKTFREDEVIHCTTAEESAAIWKLLNEIGKSTSTDMWRSRSFETKGLCYSEHGTWCSAEWYKENHYTIIQAKAFLENNTTINTEDELLLL